MSLESIPSRELLKFIAFVLRGCTPACKPKYLVHFLALQCRTAHMPALVFHLTPVQSLSLAVLATAVQINWNNHPYLC